MVKVVVLINCVVLVVNYVVTLLICCSVVNCTFTLLIVFFRCSVVNCVVLVNFVVLLNCVFRC